MRTLSKEEAYISLLEAINKSEEPEALYNEAFQIICKLFDVTRVQIWEKVSNLDEVSVFNEYFEGKESSMIKYRLKMLPENAKKFIEKRTVWECLNIENEILNKFEINSLIGVDFHLPNKNKGILVLTSREKNKQLTNDEVIFLIKLVSHLEVGVSKVEKLFKSIDESKRLQIQNNKLREQDHLRTNFINNISHELRTPLASVIGFSKMLTSKNPPISITKEIAEQIQQAANRLYSLITDFLQINKIDTEGWLANFELCDLGELIKKSVDEFKHLNKKHNISYVISEHYPILKTDPKLVRHVLDNLITNAIKYSPSGGNIRVMLELAHNKREVEISVSDEGIGIDEDETPHIFSRFFRSNNPQIKNIPGTGLGLAICKEIVTILNGKIKVESKLSKGSKFTVTLPTA